MKSVRLSKKKSFFPLRLHRAVKGQGHGQGLLWNIAPNMVHDQSKWKNSLKAAMKSPTHGSHGKWKVTNKYGCFENDIQLQLGLTVTR